MLRNGYVCRRSVSPETETTHPPFNRAPGSLGDADTRRDDRAGESRLANNG